MHVLITTPVFPPELGGPSTFVPHFASTLVRLGHQATVLTFADKPVDEQLYSYPVRTVLRGSLPGRYRRFFLEARRLGRQADLFLICEHPSQLSLWAARMTGAKTVLRMMVDPAWELSYRFGLFDGDPVRFQTDAKGARIALVRMMRRRAFKSADRILAVSRHLQQVALDIGVSKHKTWVSYNLPPPGIDAPKDGAKRIPSSGSVSAQESTILLTICRLVGWKGVQHLIDLLPELPRSYCLWIAGDGPDRKALEDLARERNVWDRVRFLGRIGEKDVKHCLHYADILLLHSIYEGLSHVLLEGMAAGIPMIVSDVPGNRELISDGENGFLADYGDLPAWEERIKRLANDSTMARRFGDASRRRLRTIQNAHPFEKLIGRMEKLVMSS